MADDVRGSIDDLLATDYLLDQDLEFPMPEDASLEALLAKFGGEMSEADRAKWEAQAKEFPGKVPARRARRESRRD